MISTPDECVEFVNSVGLCAWSAGTPLPSVAEQTPWGDQAMLHTWFWKDDLHMSILIAAQGDCDPRDLYEKNLPYPPKTSQTPPLAQLQQHFLITKVGLTGRSRGTYGYLYGLCQEFFPDAFLAASSLSVAEARAALTAHTGLQEATLKKALRWQEVA